MKKTQSPVAGFGDGGKESGAWDVGGLWKLKKAGKWILSFQRPPTSLHKATQPCGHLNFHLVRPILHF